MFPGRPSASDMRSFAAEILRRSSQRLAPHPEELTSAVEPEAARPPVVAVPAKKPHGPADTTESRDGGSDTLVSPKAVQVAYQPIFNLNSGMTVGVEALGLWAEDAIDALSPLTTHVGVAGQEILATAIAQGSTWRQHREYAPAVITANLSTLDLLDPDLVPMISVALATHGLDPRRLCIEVNESALMEDIAATAAVMGRLKDLGLLLAIDDFGTGHSSLSHLRKLPVDILKVDRSFVQSIYNREDRVIAKAVIDLAHTLGMTTIAEGVETRLQVEVLHALNCDMAQGPYLQCPVSADALDFGQIDFDAPSPIENSDLRFAPSTAMSSFVRR